MNWLTMPIETIISIQVKEIYSQSALKLYEKFHQLSDYV